MQRRDFLSSLLGGGLMLGARPLFGYGEDADVRPYPATELSDGALRRLGGLDLQELLDWHRRHLLEVFLPPWTEHGVDWEFGGYYRAPQTDGPPAEHTKEMYYLGRGLWMYSYIYNHISPEARFLDAARRGREFILRHALRTDDTFHDSVSRRGQVVDEVANIYGDMYAILGLTEFSRAEPHPEDIALARRCAHKIMERITSPSYMYEFVNHGGPEEPGERRLGAWQHFLSALTPLLRYEKDPAIDQIAMGTVRNIMERHWRPELGAFLELLDHQYEPYPVGSGKRATSGWHSIQACWMVQDEALRRGDRVLYRDATEKGLRVMEKVYVEGVGPMNLPDPSVPAELVENTPGARWGALDDALVFCLMTIEHIHAPWAIEYYNRMFELYNTNPLGRSADLLHHPRRLFASIKILERMIERGGRASNFLEPGRREPKTSVSA